MEVAIEKKYEPIAKYILYHQMFSEPNFIRDRRNTIKIPVEGSGKIIHKMLGLLLENISLWDLGKEEEFIVKITEELKLEQDIILEKYQNRLEFLNEEQLSDKPAKLMLVYCDLLTSILDNSKDRVLADLFESVSDSIEKEVFDGLITNLPDDIDAKFNIILNLAILQDFANIVELDSILISNSQFISSLISYLIESST